MPEPSDSKGGRVAFYDFDGTLVSGNVVTRYARLVRGHPDRAQARRRYGKALLGVPVWLALDAVSRRAFNSVFFRQYRGLEEEWLRSEAVGLFESAIGKEQFPYAMQRVALDRTAGYRTVLVSGGLDFHLEPAKAYFGFDDLLANRLRFHQGTATGELFPPLLAGEWKATVIRDYAAARGFDMRDARAYSDSGSDIPMLRVVGNPVATNPDRRLRKAALSSGWEIVDLRRSPNPTHRHASPIRA